jgi:hypothetical protein
LFAVVEPVFVVLPPNRPPVAGWLGAVAGVELAVVLLVPPKRLLPEEGAAVAPLPKTPPEAGAVVVAGVELVPKIPPPAVEAGGCAGVVDAPAPNMLPPVAPNGPPVEGWVAGVVDAALFPNMLLPPVFPPNIGGCALLGGFPAGVVEGVAPKRPPVAGLLLLKSPPDVAGVDDGVAPLDGAPKLKVPPDAAGVVDAPNTPPVAGFAGVLPPNIGVDPNVNPDCCGCLSLSLFAPPPPNKPPLPVVPPNMMVAVRVVRGSDGNRCVEKGRTEVKWFCGAVRLRR